MQMNGEKRDLWLPIVGHKLYFMPEVGATPLSYLWWGKYKNTGIYIRFRPRDHTCTHTPLGWF